MRPRPGLSQRSPSNGCRVVTESDYSDYAPDEAEAIARAKRWKDADPFKFVKASLLSREHIEAYVKATAMIHPFHPDRDESFKGASYEIRAAQELIRWEDGRKVISAVGSDGKLVLPPNSISFAQIESRIRLPNYIAIRFNLRIKHVHRGLLLGTGPLVDPNFEGDLLIPLHNLTASEYVIDASEGLIWVEFTKTSRVTDADVSLRAIPAASSVWPPSGGKWLSVAHYFEKANRNRPIESSIPGEIKQAKTDSKNAILEARRAKRTNQIFVGLGIVAIASVVVGIGTLLWEAETRIDSAYTVSQEAKAAYAETKRLGETEALKKRIEDLERRLGALEAAAAARPAVMPNAVPTTTGPPPATGR